MDLDIEKIAGLSRLALTDAEKQRFTKDFDGIVNYIKQLQAVDTEGVQPVNGGTDQENVFRDPALNSKNDREALVEAFPKEVENLLEVPKIFS
jgi:aspartyl-tRNA(Asn)/glutamyl-tRNA(Gln) amidotransferase subunit C